MADRDEVAAKADEAYKEISGGTDLKSLIKAVKAAQSAKGRQPSKKELKAKAALAKAEAAAKAEEDAQAALMEAMAKEAELARLEAEAQDKAAKAAETRARREAAVAAERARRDAQATKVKNLKRTVDRAIGVALKSVTAQQINDITRLQASLKTAWAALPPSMQFAEDREKLIENDQIIDDLKEIYRQQQEQAEAKTKVVEKTVESTKEEKVGNSFMSSWAAIKRAGKVAQTALGGGTRTMSGLLKAGAFGALGAARTVNNALGTAVMSAPGVGINAVKSIASGITKVAQNLKEVKDSTKEWFKDKFGTFFRRLWGVIRAPFSMAKTGGSFLAKALSWGTLLTSVLLPIVEGLYKELADKFSFDYVAKKFDEFKDWAFNKIADFFSFLKQPAQEVVQKGVDLGKAVQAKGQELGNKMGLPMQDPNNKTQNPDLRQLQDVYKFYKDSGNVVTRNLYAWQVRRQLSMMDPNAVPDDLAQKLVADGFQPQSKNTPFAKALAAKAAPVTSSAVGKAVVTAGAPADGGSSKPVTATPPSKSFAEASGQTYTKQGSSPGASVLQVPRSMLDDQTFALFSGMLSY